MTAKPPYAFSAGLLADLPEGWSNPFGAANQENEIMTDDKKQGATPFEKIASGLADAIAFAQGDT
ncbi:hypothetical protein DWA11_20575, partial [Acinetobacter baumannii]|uniref:hypothetical protein n=1 Tax=Acinetobacter baumannii TaxID=470 RepID=UPI001059E035